jgi:hypothetical protein
MTASFGTRGSQVQILPLRPNLHRNGTETPDLAIPGNSKAFKAWWVQQCAADPRAHELAFAAGLAFSTLQTRELNRDPFKSRAVADLAAGALGDFARLWAAHAEARP